MDRKKVKKTRILNEDGIGGIEYGSTNIMQHVKFTNDEEPKRESFLRLKHSQETVYLIKHLCKFISGPAIIHVILLNRTFRVILLTAAIGVCLPTIFYMTFYSREFLLASHMTQYGTCGYYDVYHLPCGVEVSEQN